MVDEPFAACSAARMSVVLPVPGFADQHRDTGTAGQPVLQMHERFAVLCGETQEPRIRRQVEGPLLQPVIPFVHGYLNSLHATVAHTASTAVAAAPTASCGEDAAPPPRLSPHVRHRRQHHQVQRGAHVGFGAQGAVEVLGRRR